MPSTSSTGGGANDSFGSRGELAKAIPRRARVSWWLGVVFALAFAVIVTPAITAERWLSSIMSTTVVKGEPAPLTVRVPAAGVETPDRRVGGGSKPGGVVIGRGVEAETDDVINVEAVEAARPKGALPYVAFFVLTFVFGAIFVHHMRRSNKGRLVRVQLVSLATVALVAVAVKVMLLVTALSVLVVPVALLALVPTIVLDRIVGLATGILAALVVSLLAPFDVNVAILMLVQASVAGLVVAEHPKVRWRTILVAGLVTTVFTTGTYVLLSYFTTGALPQIGAPLRSPLLAAALGGALAMVAALWSVPIYQLLVGEITEGKLVALEDLSHPLLRQIAERAPGTWQHSLMMANMADIAANAIGASGRLVRVGAYFHDLGKSLSPKYFIENLEPGEISPHDKLPPEVSCDAIFAHVTEGIVTARRSGLHERIVDFMHMHHGNGVLEYFWGKCKEQGNPRNLSIEQFRYPGHPPQTRETAILAICDAVEAASRTLKKPDPATIDSLVQRIVYGKLHLGQLDESGLSMADLRRVSDSLRETIRHANHGRIEYPWQKAQQDASASSEQLTSGTGPRLDSLDRKPSGRETGARPSLELASSSAAASSAGAADSRISSERASRTSAEAFAETADVQRDALAIVDTAPQPETASGVRSWDPADIEAAASAPGAAASSNPPTAWNPVTGWGPPPAGPAAPPAAVASATPTAPAASAPPMPSSSGDVRVAFKRPASRSEADAAASDAARAAAAAARGQTLDPATEAARAAAAAVRGQTLDPATDAARAAAAAVRGQTLDPASESAREAARAAVSDAARASARGVEPRAGTDPRTGAPFDPRTSDPRAGAAVDIDPRTGAAWSAAPAPIDPRSVDRPAGAVPFDPARAGTYDMARGTDAPIARPGSEAAAHAALPPASPDPSRATLIGRGVGAPAARGDSGPHARPRGDSKPPLAQGTGALGGGPEPPDPARSWNPGPIGRAFAGGQPLTTTLRPDGTPRPADDPELARAATAPASPGASSPGGSSPSSGPPPGPPPDLITPATFTIEPRKRSATLPPAGPRPMTPSPAPPLRTSGLAVEPDEAITNPPIARPVPKIPETLAGQAVGSSDKHAAIGPAAGPPSQATSATPSQLDTAITLQPANRPQRAASTPPRPPPGRSTPPQPQAAAVPASGSIEVTSLEIEAEFPISPRVSNQMYVGPAAPDALDPDTSREDAVAPPPSRRTPSTLPRPEPREPQRPDLENAVTNPPPLRRPPTNAPVSTKLPALIIEDAGSSAPRVVAVYTRGGSGARPMPQSDTDRTGQRQALPRNAVASDDDSARTDPNMIPARRDDLDERRTGPRPAVTPRIESLGGQRGASSDDDGRITGQRPAIARPSDDDGRITGQRAAIAQPVEDNSRTEPSMPRFELPLQPPPPSNPMITLPGPLGTTPPTTLPGTQVPPIQTGPVKKPWAKELAARVDRALDEADEWGPETPVVAPTKAELRALLGAPDPTRKQSIAELERLHRAAEDVPSEPEILQGSTRRPAPATAEVDPDQIEAAIELAPPARRPNPNVIAVAKPKKPE